MHLLRARPPAASTGRPYGPLVPPPVSPRSAARLRRGGAVSSRSSRDLPGPSSSSSSDSESADDEPGRRVAMAMAASWGGRAGAGGLASSSKNNAAPASPRPLRATATATATAPSQPAVATTATAATADSLSLSRAIAASARAAALSSQLRAAHAALPPPEGDGTATATADGSAAHALVAPVAALADAAAAASALPASCGARAGACEFYAYVLPASPFLPAWREAVRRALPSLSRRDLSDALFALGRLPYYAPAPMPIGWGTPRYARPLAAAEPDEWEALLDEAVRAWLRLPPTPAEGGGPAPRSISDNNNDDNDDDNGEEARFLLGLALARRWAGERVGDAWLSSREAEEALGRALADLPTGGGLSPAARLAAALLQVRGAPPAPLALALFEETAAPAPEGKGWPASWRADRRPSSSSLGAMISSAAAAAVAQEEEHEDGKKGGELGAADAGKQQQQQQQQQQEGPSSPPQPPQPPPPQPSLASTLLHAQPPAPPPSPPSALCSELSPKQVQRLARGLVYLGGAVPPDAWLAALAGAARCALAGGGALSRPELAALRDALKFFLSERRGEECGNGPWRRAASGGRGEDRTGLADAVSLLDEWRVGGSGEF